MCEKRISIIAMANKVDGCMKETEAIFDRIESSRLSEKRKTYLKAVNLKNRMEMLNKFREVMYNVAGSQ